ncbi:MAG: hypothetical protein QG673_198 [Pseudomonadota bacterium]|nr:hypothetical protein [Pseudomonadota bacterium]
MKTIPLKLQIWIDAREKFRLSYTQIQMARELGMNPKKFGKLDNHDQEPWKIPLPDFIEEMYYKRFSKLVPNEIKTIEQIFALGEKKKNIKEQKKALEVTNILE